MRYGSICSGIEAATVAWHPIGWTPVFFAEIEPFPSAVLAHRFAHVPNLGDMTTIDGAAWRDKIDLLVGGTPCQAFSVAGKRESLADDRGNLTLKFVELVHAADPKWLVWENVPGVLSTKDNAFGCFLAGLVGEGEPLVCGSGSWPDAGMVVGPRRSACWRVLDGQYFGLAQRRRRVFVVSGRTGDGKNPGAVLFEPESVPGNPPPSRETGARVAGCFAPRTHGGGGFGTDFETDGGLIPETVGTLSDGAHYGGGQTAKTHTADELSRCLNAGGMRRQDFETETLIPVTGGFFDDATHTLRADGFDASEDGTGRGTPLVPVAFSPNDDGGGQRSISPRPSVAEWGPGRRSHMTGGSFSSDSPIPQPSPAMAVRRLTPTECERLQGFPDGWTLIPYKGKPAKNGPRYRAIGNSMAVTVMRWIGERIEMVEANAMNPP